MHGSFYDIIATEIANLKYYDISIYDEETAAGFFFGGGFPPEMSTYE